MVHKIGRKQHVESHQLPQAKAEVAKKATFQGKQYQELKQSPITLIQRIIHYIKNLLHKDVKFISRSDVVDKIGKAMQELKVSLYTADQKTDADQIDQGLNDIKRILHQLKGFATSKTTEERIVKLEKEAADLITTEKTIVKRFEKEHISEKFGGKAKAKTHMDIAQELGGKAKTEKTKASERRIKEQGGRSLELLGEAIEAETIASEAEARPADAQKKEQQAAAKGGKPSVAVEQEPKQGADDLRNIAKGLEESQTLKPERGTLKKPVGVAKQKEAPVAQTQPAPTSRQPSEPAAPQQQQAAAATVTRPAQPTVATPTQPKPEPAKPPIQEPLAEQSAKPEKRKVFGEKVRKGQEPAKFKPMEKPQALHEERPTVQGPGLAARKKIAAGLRIKSEWRIKEDKENFVKVLEKIATMVSKDVREGRASAHKPLSPNLRNIQSSQKYSDINKEIDDAIGIIEDAYTKFMIPKGIREEIEKLRQKANEKVEAEKAEDDRIKIQEDKAKKELKNRQDFDAKFKHKKLERSTEEPGPAGRGEKYYRYADTSDDYRKAAEMYEGLETTDKEDAGLRAEAEKAKQKDLATRKKFDVEHPRKELRKTTDDRGIFRREKASVKGPKFKEYDEGIKRKGITKTQEKGLYQAKQKADAARYVDKLSEERRKSGKPIHQPAQPAKPKEEKPAVKTEFRKPDIAGQEKYQGNYVGKTQERVKEAERIKYSLPTGNVIELTPEDIARDEAVLREQRMAKGQMVDEPKFAPEESLRSKGKKTVEKATEKGPKASDDLRLKNRGARVPVEEQVSEEAQPVEAGHEGRFGEAIKQKEKKAESMNKESRIKRGEELQIEREKTVRKGAGEVGKVRVPEGIQKKEAERNIKILLRKMSDSPSVQKYLGAQYSIEKRFTKGRDLGKLDSFAKKDYTTMSKAEILRDLREIEALISKASVHKERQASETDFFNELTFKVNDIMSSLE